MQPAISFDNDPNVPYGHRQNPGTSSRPPSSQSRMNLPLRLTDDESPELYLHRLEAAVSKAEVAAVLASRYVTALPRRPFV